MRRTSDLTKIFFNVHLVHTSSVALCTSTTGGNLILNDQWSSAASVRTLRVMALRRQPELPAFYNLSV